MISQYKQMLQQRDQRHAWCAYLKRNMAHENYLFMRAIDRLHTKPCTQRRNLKHHKQCKHVQNIYTTFIPLNAKHVLNLPSMCRKALEAEAHAHKLSLASFMAAYTHVQYNLLYSHFLNYTHSE